MSSHLFKLIGRMETKSLVLGYLGKSFEIGEQWLLYFKLNYRQ